MAGHIVDEAENLDAEHEARQVSNARKMLLYYAKEAEMLKEWMMSSALGCVSSVIREVGT